MQKKERRQQDSAETVHKYGSKLGDAKSLEMKNQFKDRHLELERNSRLTNKRESGFEKHSQHQSRSNDMRSV